MRCGDPAHPPKGLQTLIEAGGRVGVGGGQKVVQQQPPHRLLHQLAEGCVEDDELEVVKGEEPLGAGWKARRGLSVRGGVAQARRGCRHLPCSHWLSAFRRYRA